jgi:hypothetical protein
MKTQTSKTLRGLIALALALVLSLGVFTAALAADPILGDKTNPAQATITKKLRLPEGTAFPAGGLSFTFHLAPLSFNGSTAPVDTAKLPEIGERSVHFNGTDTHSTADNIVTYTKATPAIFTGVSFTTAGMHTYRVTEKAGANHLADAAVENLYYSQAEYEITAFVKEKNDGSGGFYISAIVTTITKNDDGADGSGAKVNPEGPDLVTGLYSAMTFANAYWRVNGGTDPKLPGNSTLNVSLNVEGDFSSTSVYFPIAVTVNAPSIIPGASTLTYKAYVVDGAGVVALNSNGNGARDGTNSIGDYFVFTSGTTKTISLKHGQQLVFLDTPVGTTYTANLLGSTGYKPRADIHYNGGTVNGGMTYKITALNVGDALSTGLRLVGENAPNAVVFTNTADGITPTGIIINNLPYLGLILLAVASLGAYVAVKSKKRV